MRLIACNAQMWAILSALIEVKITAIKTENCDNFSIFNFCVGVQCRIIAFDVEQNFELQAKHSKHDHNNYFLESS